jgi:hypothetical protein
VDITFKSLYEKAIALQGFVDPEIMVPLTLRVNIHNNVLNHGQVEPPTYTKIIKSVHHPNIEIQELSPFLNDLFMFPKHTNWNHNIKKGCSEAWFDTYFGTGEQCVIKFYHDLMKILHFCMMD